MNIQYIPIGGVVPYENNPRHNDNAVDAVANSIREFGWKQPIVVDKDNVIVAGHTRYKAAQKLGLDTVPVLVADDLSEEQVKAYRLADNKTGEAATWDSDLLDIELDGILDINMSLFGFEDLGEPTAAEVDEGEVTDNTQAPVAVRIVFPNAQQWRHYEWDVREFVDGIECASVVVGAYEDQ